MSVSSSPSATQGERRLAGRYLLRRPVGRGGAGVVWEARDELLGRTVAIKECILPPTVNEADRDQLIARVMREARTAARLDHPSLVTVFDVVQENERPWIVMEYVESRSLSQVVREDGPLPAGRVVEIGLAVLDALQVAHSAGVLHRDVKPANVLITDSGGVVLTDFGIAASTGDPTLTTSGVLLGSPAYMPPERARGEAASPASDLWSLAATLYTTLEGVPPYSGDHPLAVLSAVADGRRRPLNGDGELERLLADVLDAEPEDRPSAMQFRRRLERVRADLAAAPATPAAERVAGAGEGVWAAERTARFAPSRSDRRRLGSRFGRRSRSEQDVAAAAGSRPTKEDQHDESSRDGDLADALLGGAAAGAVTSEAKAAEPEPDATYGAAPDGAAPEAGQAAAEQSAAERPAPEQPPPDQPKPEQPRVEQPAPTTRPRASNPSRPVPSSRPPGAGRPARRAAATPSHVRHRRILQLGLLALVVVGAVAVVLVTVGRKTDEPPRAVPGVPAPSGTSGGSSGSSSSGGSSSGSSTGSASGSGTGAAVPAGWQTYHDSQFGWSIGVPPGFQRSSGGTTNQTDFRNPSTGELLRVEIAPQAHASAIGDWRSYEPTFARQVSNYQRIRMDPADGGDGTRAADWEFLFTDGGARLHVLNRGAIDGRSAHALYWQTRDSLWASSQQMRDTAFSTFQPPPQ